MLVLVPGLGSDGAVWRRTVDALDGQVECAIGDTLSDRRLEGMARRILGQAPPNFDLAGVSMGAMVAMEVMRIAPERVNHLALLDTNARADTLANKAYRHLADVVVSLGDYRSLAERSLGSLVHPMTPQDVRDEIVEMSLRVGSRAYVRQNRAVRARRDLRRVLMSIAVPTAVIVGREDRVTPVRMSEEIHALTPGSRLHVLPECGHLPPIEQPETVARLLKDLFRE